MQQRLFVLLAVGWSLALATSPPRAWADPSADQATGLRLFREQVEPLLKTHCYACHSSAATPLEGGLRLDSRDLIRRGGDQGPAVVPGKPGESLLVQALRHEGGLEMPPKKPRLPLEAVSHVIRWIELGAPDPRDSPPNSIPSGNESWPQSALQHWAFQPITLPAAPQTKRSVSGPIDAFLQQQLSARNWPPAEPASRPDLIRRLSFDLRGLPPAPEEVARFTRDQSPDAYDRLTDRFLASPQFGERQAQHWLDVVRFAESEGYEYDRHLPEAWRYRDYVVNAINRDLPFDQFIAEQVAGDELAPRDPNSLAAAVLHRLGPVRRNAGNPDIALSRNEVLTERTDILGAAFLGLTVGCARCHNHKLEPISQRDYYRLQAYLAATAEDNVSLASPAEQSAWEAETKRIKDEMDRLRLIMRMKTGDERLQLQAQIEALEDQLPTQPACIPTIRNDFSQRTPIHVLRRGEWEKKLAQVGPRPLSILAPQDLAELPADASQPRTELAKWLTSPQNPLVARVFANRLWQAHFGRGIVRTANDFGLHGEKPSHPELLDWLAATLRERGGRPKELHRRIVQSDAYRQASANPQAEAAQRLDPENRLLWKFSRRRLSAEELRDAMLTAAGMLNSQLGGPSVMTPVDPQLVGQLYKPSQWRVAPAAGEHARRSLYLIAKRNLRLPFMETFDGPTLLASCAQRETSIHALQSLELLNGSLSNELALRFAARLREEADVVHSAFALALGRPPTEREQQHAREFLAVGSLEEFALAIFNLNDFAYAP